MPLRAVFFDLDGTLLDTAQDMVALLNHMLKEDCLPLVDEQTTRSIVSNGSIALVKKGYQLADDDSRVEPLRERFLQHYGNNLCTHTKPFEGITQLIEELAKRDILWGIATNKPYAYAAPLMKHFRFASEPICVISPDHVTRTKPDPECLKLACDAANCKPEDAIYIGDHLRDILCGKGAGMPTIAATYGFIEDHDDPQSWAADYYVDSATEIWPLIEKHFI